MRLQRGIGGRTLTPSLSHPMGEGDHSDALDDLAACDCDERVERSSLSRPTGEGRGEGSLSPCQPFPVSVFRFACQGQPGRGHLGKGRHGQRSAFGDSCVRADWLGTNFAVSTPIQGIFSISTASRRNWSSSLMELDTGCHPGWKWTRREMPLLLRRVFWSRGFGTISLSPRKGGVKWSRLCGGCFRVVPHIRRIVRSRFFAGSLIRKRKTKTLTPALSHPMGEGDRPDAWDGFLSSGCNQRVDQFSLSRLTEEGRGEGPLFL